ncbi:MAG: glycine--tRNA ligase subunit beta [Methylococcales bacterium]|nr:glycine--tRNA ligase subunit beta [Methylococcales bacterium]
MASKSDFLFEIGTEELPPKSLCRLRDALRDNLSGLLNQNKLDFDAIRAFATPRRLAILVSGLAAAQPDSTSERKGPSVSAAFDSDGNPTKAAEGFARSCGVGVDQLDRQVTGKGEWLFFREEVQGAETESLLAEMVNESLARLPIAKRMRWGTGSTEFVRPVHWSVLLYGDRSIEARVLGTVSGRVTYGHRFHAPDAIVLESPDEYAGVLETRGKVVADFEVRRERIRGQVEKIARGLGAIALVEDDLLDEVTSLVEWPVAVAGSFDARFLDLPSEVLITTMQTNQKYFPLISESGELRPGFITVSNIESLNPASISSGNERVIRPRFSDAEFFWTQDRKQTLENRLPALEGIVYQKKLGTLAQKSNRVTALAEFIAGEIQADAESAVRAARLAKADLLTDMVGEFPSLQGTMGRYYSLADGESSEVAQAIEEQYLPKQSGGALPKSLAGQVLSVAEKLDSLVGIFSAGLIPSGDKDPYGLRRSALGLIRVLVEKKLDLDILRLIDVAVKQLPEKLHNDQLAGEISSFIHDRLRGYCLDRGFRADEFDAVLAVHPTRPLDFEKRLQAVAGFRSLAAAESLAAANKRIQNILRKSGTDADGEVDPACFQDPEESRLFESMIEAADAVNPMLERDDYTEALRRLSELRVTVDLFFENVMVMVEDPGLQNNRLALLSGVQSLFLRIADISRLQ